MSVERSFPPASVDLLRHGDDVVLLEGQLKLTKLEWMWIVRNYLVVVTALELVLGDHAKRRGSTPASFP